MKIFAFAGFFLLLMAVSACSGLRLGQLERPRYDYQSARSVNSLEIPPDLTAPDSSQALRLPQLGETVRAQDIALAAPRTQKVSQVLLTPEKLRLVSSGDLVYLQTPDAPAVLWPKLRAFWPEQGLTLRQDKPELGFMETEWVENRATLPKSKIPFFARFIDSIYSTNTLDKFRLRLEQDFSGNTLIYIQHQGLEEVSRSDAGGFIWQPRPSDPNLEAALLRQLSLYLGAAEEQVMAQLAEVQKQIPRAEQRTDSEGRPVILLRLPYGQSLTLVKQAITRLGARIEAEDNDARTVSFVVDESDNLALPRRQRQEYRYALRFNEKAEGTELLLRDAKTGQAAGSKHSSDYLAALTQALR
jgi:outer membrane protein assembly factor BamC